MADKIAKLLQKLPPNQLEILLPVTKKIITNDLVGLDVKKLKAHDGHYRIRVGNYRVIFRLPLVRPQPQ